MLQPSNCIYQCIYRCINNCLLILDCTPYKFMAWTGSPTFCSCGHMLIRSWCKHLTKQAVSIFLCHCRRKVEESIVNQDCLNAATLMVEAETNEYHAKHHPGIPIPGRDSNSSCLPAFALPLSQCPPVLKGTKKVINLRMKIIWLLRKYLIENLPNAEHDDLKR